MGRRYAPCRCRSPADRRTAIRLASKENSMPWSNQGGGPWGSGSGGKGPWGTRPQSTGPTPPDLEDLLRRTQDGVRNVLPGAGLSSRGFAILAVLVVLVWGASGFFTVATNEVGVVLRFGKYVRDVPAGWGYHLPYPIETVLTPQVTAIRPINVGMR